MREVGNQRGPEGPEVTRGPVGARRPGGAGERGSGWVAGEPGTGRPGGPRGTGRAGGPEAREPEGRESGGPGGVPVDQGSQEGRGMQRCGGSWSSMVMKFGCYQVGWRESGWNEGDQGNEGEGGGTGMGAQGQGSRDRKGRGAGNSLSDGRIGEGCWE